MVLVFLRFVTSDLNAKHRRQHTKLTITKKQAKSLQLCGIHILIQSAQQRQYEYCRRYSTRTHFSEREKKERVRFIRFWMAWVMRYQNGETLEFASPHFDISLREIWALIKKNTKTSRSDEPFLFRLVCKWSHCNDWLMRGDAWISKYPLPEATISSNISKIEDRIIFYRNRIDAYSRRWREQLMWTGMSSHSVFSLSLPTKQF